MTPTDRTELRRLAAAATQGPWFVQYGDDDNHMCMTAVSTDNTRNRNDGQFTQGECEKFIAVTLHQLYPWVDADCTNDDANSAYIAAASPDAILALLADLDALRNLITKLHAAKGRYHSQLACCDLFDAVGLKNERPVK